MRRLALLAALLPVILGAEDCDPADTCLDGSCADMAAQVCGGEPVNFLCAYDPDLGCTVLVSVDCGVAGPTP